MGKSPSDGCVFLFGLHSMVWFGLHHMVWFGLHMVWFAQHGLHNMVWFAKHSLVCTTWIGLHMVWFAPHGLVCIPCSPLNPNQVSILGGFS